MCTTRNDFYCPGIINVLMSTYMGIFPLWSGILLGDLSRYSKESIKEIKTRETNCHVEQWFSIVKNHILQRKRFLRPADLISKMFNSLQGRYKQHRMMYNIDSLSQDARFTHTHVGFYGLRGLSIGVMVLYCTNCMCYCPTPTLHLNLALTGDGAFLLSPKKHTLYDL